MDKYLAFKMSQYYPTGGMDDLVGVFSSREEALIAIGKLSKFEWGQIVHIFISSDQDILFETEEIDNE